MYDVATGKNTTYSAGSVSLYAICASADGNVWFTGQTFGKNPTNFIGVVKLTPAT